MASANSASRPGAAAPSPASRQAAAAPKAPSRGVAALPVENRGLLTVGVMLATIMQILDSTIANVALPHMQASLGATADTVTWVLTSYIVASAIAIPAAGWLSDKIGSRNLFIFCIVGFVASSMLCGLATGLTEMVAFRFVQGTCAAFMNPLSQTVMMDINPPEKQARALSIWGMGIMIGPILGPVIGGWLTESYNWRWVFYINVPLGIAAFAILWALLPSRPQRERQFDLFGFSMLAVAVAAFQLMLDRGQNQDWFSSWEIIVEGLVAISCFWVFLVHLFTAKNPLFDREILRDRNLMTSVAFMLVVGMVLIATMALLPPMLQTLYGYPVLDTGFLMMPRGVGVLISMSIAGQLLQRNFDARILVGTGLVIAIWSLYDMTGWTLMMGTMPFILTGLIQGLGLGLIFIPLNTLAFGTLDPQYRTEGTSLMNLARNVGASVGISVVTAELARNLQQSHSDIAQHITPQAFPFDPGLAQALGSAGDAAAAMVNGLVTQQAAMVAYLDDFKLMMVMTAVAIPLVFLLKRPEARQGAKAEPVDMH
ncbi:DHA2 family efflux MFS transporter permease subunit [Stakelama marina]|uniref:DHA2 family efflux MFS transporter permease subunit n=1 Tax=Stakelama marina TaxID=2826939 RepID=A0A8T4IB53_9SPHN|nr:DHA2 family efflux MFS transporter permease subunit [Stakelama marina]MBR0551780.1 DHA2 family efflux MFS transporter permease subunit [Stakelama marina]